MPVDFDQSISRSATACAVNSLPVLDNADTGSITVGQYADLLILDDNPLDDLQNLSHAYRVLKGGRIYDPVELMKSVR